MKRSVFAIVALVAGIMSIVPVILFLIIDGLALGEAHPVSVVAFPLVMLFSLPEAAVQGLNVPWNFPLVLPLIAVVSCIASLARKEPKKGLAIAGVVLVGIALATLLLM